MAESETEEEARPAPSFEGWLAEIREIGCSDPLSHFKDNSFGQINLERAHPGGLAQFVTGRPALLSNLVRDPLSFSRALAAAKRIKAKQVALLDHFGLETLYMASGLVDLTPDGHNLRMPILLWPVNLITKHDDFELSLSRKAIVNPALAPALAKAYSVRLNNEDLLAQVQVGSDPIPMRILEHITDLLNGAGNPELRRIQVISNFSAAASELAADFEVVQNPVLDLFLNQVPQDSENDSPGVADPILVTDSDHTQTRIVSRALAGGSFAVETLPGCGYTQTVVLLLAALAQQGKRALVLSPRRQTLNELADRLAHLGLPGLGVRSSASWLDMISAISRNEKAQPDSYDAARTLRDRAREEVAEYFVAFENIDGELGVSISQALEELARLSASKIPPVNEARIDADQLGRHRDRAFALTLLKQAQELGEFDWGPEDSAWYRAKFDSPQQVDGAKALASRLHENTFRELSEQLTEFTRTVEFLPAETVSDWVSYLDLFVGLRESLDKFRPEVFDRPLNELILATAPRKDKSVMSGANRRRLKKLAKEYLRPGMHVADMHQSLRNIQSQREKWQKFALVPKPPQVPLGIKDAQQAVSKFVADLNELQSHLDPESITPPLAEQPLSQLAATLRSLAETTKFLDNYSERAMTQSRIDEAGLGPLARELSLRHARRETLEAELELSWWKSALETLLARSGGSLSGDHSRVVEKETHYARTETNLMSQAVGHVNKTLAEKWQFAISKFGTESQTLKELLRLKRGFLSEVGQLAPNVYRTLVPAVLLSPYEVPATLAKGDQFDVALILDGAGSSIAENLAGLKRVRQAIIFGDDAIAAATGFNLECQAEPERRELPQSIFTEAKRVMPTEVLRRSYRTSGQALGSYINSEFYQNRIIFEPTAASYFGLSNVSMEKVHRSMGEEGESLESEVNQTVELIFNHALWNPGDSLLVATASSKHAARLDQALQQGMRSKAHLAEFFESHGREKFEITTISELAHRTSDRIIFSVGFGKKNDRSLPEAFGDLAQPDGKRYLANLLVSARKQITLVSCFDAGELADSQIPGADLLERLLQEVVKRPEASVETEVSPMIADLAIRLAKLGLTARTNFSTRIKLVASIGDRAAVIEPDFGLLGYNLSERHRLRPQLLRAMGWDYIRVPSFELFSDPEAVAQRIAITLGVELTKRPQPLFEFDEKSFEDTARAWGDREDSNDDRLREDRPPHWG